ncbi:MAG: alpha/beta fold hydrolase [Odoribacteraceae bacterium]|jgi:pimeloyl-ACP methyl ester carboxylesterase|nr:alpha/beta fold hydrolase [Odoribacteraceae bacterium]
MNEQVFSITVKDEMIYGIWSRPETVSAESGRTAVILLHGWGGYRTGPHDMLVKLARRLSGNGYDCFRFDFRGKGYSQGDRRQTGNRTMLEDLETVIPYVQKQLHHPQIILAGICSGARLALYYARNGKYPVLHVIAMSSPLLRQQEMASTLAAGQSKNTLWTYLRKVFRKETWLKLTGGEIHFRAVWKNLFRPVADLLLFSVRRRKKGKRKAKGRPIETKSSEVQPFGQLQGRLLLIHGEKDPETKPALSQIHAMLQRHHVSSDTHIVKEANHSFYSLAWEKEILQVIEDWLKIESRKQ